MQSAVAISRRSQSVLVREQLAKLWTSRPVLPSGARASAVKQGRPPIALLHTATQRRVALTPESNDPQPPETQEHHNLEGIKPSPISASDYHEKADVYLDTLMARLEDLAEEKEGVDVDYSSGVLTVSLPSVGQYVLNKQPALQQIWLSSPISGPKRFDWVVVGEGQHEKEGAGQSHWVYVRDGTSLSELLRKEIGVNVKQEHAEESEV